MKNPPYFEGMTLKTGTPTDIKGARVLALLGDSVTTDHISPAGNIAADSPAGKYLESLGVQKKDFNSYGARRGNHEVMVRGTFANIRLKNKLVPGTEGDWTMHMPSGEKMSIYDASMKYQAAKHAADHARRQRVRRRLVARLGREGHRVARRARRHRGELRAHPPLEPDRHGRRAAAVPRRRKRPTMLGLTGNETFDIVGLAARALARSESHRDCGRRQEEAFTAVVRIDTPKEQDYFIHGGILQYVLRQLASGKQAA